jgi:hypothetical protein
MGHTGDHSRAGGHLQPAPRTSARWRIKLGRGEIDDTDVFR